MTIQVLISTMNQKDYSLLDRMNIQSDAIVVNQCDVNEIVEFKYKEHNIKWISLAERGIGLSRNTALMRATADILLFADDDVVYCDDYPQIVCSEFSRYSRADFFTFNLESLNVKRPEHLDKKNHRLHWYNSLRYGAFRFCIRRVAALKNNLFFSLLFGGGACHQAGEDNLFITQSLKRGLNVRASCKTIGSVAQKESTWFNGYNEKYYFDRGYLFANMFGWKAKPLLLFCEIREGNRKSQLTLLKRLKQENKGIRVFRKDETSIGDI